MMMTSYCMGPSFLSSWQAPLGEKPPPSARFGHSRHYLLTFRASFREKMRFELSSWDEHNNHSNPRTRRRHTSYHCAPQEHARGRIIRHTLPAQWQLAGLESRRDDGRVVGLHPLRGEH